MSISALFSRSAFLQHPRNIKEPLAVRFTKATMGFMSVGAGGISIATIALGPDGPSVTYCKTTPEAATPANVATWAKTLRKKLPSFAGAPVILGCSSKLEWQLRRSLEHQTNAAFVFDLRTDPAKIIGSVSENLVYTGLLQESGGGASGLVLSVVSQELAAAEEALAQAGCEVVRMTIPALAMLNLMLASDQVVVDHRIPIVIDQGFALAVLSTDGVWQECQGRQLIGNNTTTEHLHEMLERIGATVPSPKYLVAVSPANGDANISAALAKTNADVVTFELPNIKSDHLFPHATALF